MSMQCAVSIDVDSLACYYRIHGLGAPPAQLRDVLIQRAVPRAHALFAEFGVPVTWFVVGEDVDVERAPHDPGIVSNAAVLRALAEAGAEIGNHSYSHWYDFARRSAGDQFEEIARAHRAIMAATGQAPRGFRAPGYDIAPATIAALARQGYRYDSSVFGSVPYYVAKAAVMGMLALRGTASGAVLTNPRALGAPRLPYPMTPDRPWHGPHTGHAVPSAALAVWELPISITPWARLPAIGTSLLLAPAPIRRYLLAQMLRLPFFNFELHAIDFADATVDELPTALVARQPDLRLPFAVKAERLRGIVKSLMGRATFTRCVDIADQYAGGFT